MKTLTKINIEELAKEIMEFLEKEGLASDTSIYFNNKVIRNEIEWGEVIKRDDEWGDDYSYTLKWKTTEDVNPHDYFEYCAYDHILSMSFEGPLYDVLNYTFGRKEEEFNTIFEKWGLYYEFGNAWNLSAYPIDSNMEIEYTKYGEPKKTIQLYRWNRMKNPSELQSIMDEWFVLSSLVGDKGSCVLGAGFEFEWEDDKYFMCACSPHQGSISWETPKDKIQKMLEDIGATNIYYKWGNMD